MLEMIRNSFRRLHDQEGATAVEYGIMVAAIAAVIIAVVIVIGKQVSEGFQTTCDNLETSSATTSTC